MEQEPGAHNLKQNEGLVPLHSASYDIFILVMTIYSLAVALGILVSGNLSTDAILYWSDFLVCIVFLIDFLLNMRQAPSKVGYFLRQGGWLDLLGAIPAVPGLPWTALFRLARLNRLVRIIQHLSGKDREEVITESRQSPAGTLLMTTVLVAFILLTTASLFVLRFERGAPGANITTGAIAFWWAFVTMTTVGYGDYVPVTNSGRLLATGLMTFGIGIFAVLTSFIASKFAVQRSDRAELVSLLKEENASIQAEIAELKELITQQREGE